ncbi:hypothetical protein [Actinomadura madurae]|nr:hypothetical protein [Actinomadura madurae]
MATREPDQCRWQHSEMSLCWVVWDVGLLSLFAILSGRFLEWPP